MADGAPTAIEEADMDVALQSDVPPVHDAGTRPRSQLQGLVVVKQG